MPINNLPLSKKIAYATGMAGWSILTNLVIVMLPYFYLPPENSGLQPLIPQIIWWGVINLFSVIVSVGRLSDAFIDPFIAQWSDRSTHPRGRRIPFLKWSMIPFAFFCAMLFYPPHTEISIHNATWLAVFLIVFFISSTAYIIPYNAMLPELAPTSAEKVQLSSFQQSGFVIGMILSAFANNLADVAQYFYPLLQRPDAVRYAIMILCMLALVFLAIPVFFIDERTYCKAGASHTPIWPAIRQAFSHSNFRAYLIADFSFYIALSLISSGLLYYVTVLAGLDQSEGSKFMGVLVVGSLLFYPVVNASARKFGKKKTLITAFSVLSVTFTLILFIGKMSLEAHLQLYLLMICTMFPLAAIGILPNAILSEIATRDAAATGENKEGMFFAVKYFFVKLGQTIGIALFALFTIFGISQHNDWGLRLHGIIGFALCCAAGVAFLFYKDEKQ